MTRYYILLALLILSSCDVGNKKRENDTLLPPAEVPNSTIGFQVNLPISVLREGISESLPRIILDQSISMNGSTDSLYLTLIRTGDIDLNYDGNQLNVKVPIDARVAVKQKILGITFSNRDTPVVFGGTAMASADVNLRDDWELDIACFWKGLNKEESPRISLGGVSIDIGGTLDRLLDKHSDLIANSICNAIQEAFSLKEVIGDFWGELHRTERIRFGKHSAWLHSKPIGLTGKLVKNSDRFSLNAELSASIQITDQQVINNPKTKLPKRVSSLNDDSKILAYPELSLKYEFLQKLLEENLVGQTLDLEGYSSKILKVAAKPAGQVLQVELTLEGDIDGVLVVLGRPAISEDLQLHIEDFEYSLDADDELMAFTDVLLHSVIENYIDSAIKMDLEPFVKNIDQIIDGHLAFSGLDRKAKFNVSIDDLNTYELRMTDSGLQWILALEGRGSVDLKKSVFNSGE